MNNDVQAFVAAVTTWSAAAIALMWAHQSEIMFGLGLVLMVARLVQELPKAIDSIKKWFGNE